MRRVWPWLAVIFLLSLTMGCGMSQEKQAAEAVAGQFHTALQAKKFDDAVALCNASFFKNTSKKDTRDFLDNLTQRLGEFKRAKLVGWHFNKQAMSGGGSGTYYTLTYEASFAKYQGTETILVYKPFGGNTFSVLGYNINSPGLVKG